MVPPGRLELPLPQGKQILSLPRLPIPPQGPGRHHSRAVPWVNVILLARYLLLLLTVAGGGSRAPKR